MGIQISCFHYRLKDGAALRASGPVDRSLQKALSATSINRYLMEPKQGYALMNWVEGVSDEALYTWESPKNFLLKLVSPTSATEQKKVLIH